MKNYPSAKFKGKSPAKYPYKDCIVEMDDILGRLVKTLDDTKQLENTLIFVLSDNGPMMEPWPDAGYTPFRGGIGTTWEGGVRVPGIVYWKGMIKPGQVSDELFDLADLFTTSAALAGVDYQPPEDRVPRRHRPDVVPAGGRGPVEPKVRILLAGANDERATCGRIQVHACRHVVG